MSGPIPGPRAIQFQEDMSFKVQLTRGYWAQVDAADLPRVMELTWNASPNAMGGHYAMTQQGGQTVYMHRLIMDAPKGKMVDHLNHDTLDNRRANLRIGGQSMNMLNRKGANSNSTTRVRGLYRHKIKDRWYWNIRVELNGKAKTRNFPPTEEGKAEAIAALMKWQANPEAAHAAPRTRQYIKTRPGRWEKT